jgi:glyoxalase family protein
MLYNNILGLHHVTALSSSAQQNVDFYAGILGLRLVKKTVNFDSPDVYHLYFGDETGSPGTILTFFPYEGMPKGRKGNGQVTVTSFSVPENSLDYWIKRLERFNIVCEPPRERFENELFVYFEDQDGLGIELVASKTDEREGFTDGLIPKEFVIKGFHSITLNVKDPEKTAALLTLQMDHTLIAEKNDRKRFSASGKPGGFVDILTNSSELRSIGGAGTVHHVAFATPNDKTQTEIRERLLNGRTADPTPVIDRMYFHSVYFREPGGVLFEVATCDIGMTLDEPKEKLGESLMLPPWHEVKRSEIEINLGPVSLNAEKFRDYARL